MLDEINYIVSEMCEKISSNFLVENRDINREKFNFKLLNQFKEAQSFSEIDESWTEYSTLKDHITTFILASSIEVKLKEEDVLRVWKDKWLMSDEISLALNWNEMGLSFYRYGTFIKSQLDFAYKIEVSDNENDKLIYKKLFFCLPSNINKWELYEEVFGDSHHKFRTVILDILNDYFEYKTNELKNIVQNTINELAELFYEKMNNTSNEMESCVL